MGRPIVQLKELRKSYGSVPVLQGITLDIEAGQHVAIIGRSGSGKSTLLRLIMTLDRPDDGSILIDGEELWHEGSGALRRPARQAHTRRMRAKVGMVFQQFNLFPHMTAMGNVSVAPRRVLRLPRDQAEARARELLGMVGLEDKAQRYPAELSGGQKQRVAIARTLAMRPQVVLFDEVTSALDPELVGEVQSVLKKLARETQMTMLVVTHEIPFARDISDRAIFLDGGLVVEDGPPQIVLNQPQSEATRLFLQSVLDKA